MTTRSFKDLIVWQRSAKMAAAIYKSFSSCKDFGFRDQIQRASISVMNNIAEGYAKRSDKAFKNYLYIARGSAAEIESMLLIAHYLNYIDLSTQSKLLALNDEVAKLISNFIKKLTTNS